MLNLVVLLPEPIKGGIVVGLIMEMVATVAT